jgi:hypothetical protein
LSQTNLISPPRQHQIILQAKARTLFKMGPAISSVSMARTKYSRQSLRKATRIRTPLDWNRSSRETRLKSATLNRPPTAVTACATHRPATTSAATDILGFVVLHLGFGIGSSFRSNSIQISATRCKFGRVRALSIIVIVDPRMSAVPRQLRSGKKGIWGFIRFEIVDHVPSSCLFFLCYVHVLDSF